jgi:hypothetical protein
MNLNRKKEEKQRTPQPEALMGTIIRLCGPAGDEIPLARLSLERPWPESPYRLNISISVLFGCNTNVGMLYSGFLR